MRLFPLIAVCALAGCMSTPDAQVSKSYPDPTAGGLALPAMQERLARCNGSLEIQSQPGQGTEITARIPLRPPLSKEILR